jgi:hypothetical protein
MGSFLLPFLAGSAEESPNNALSADPKPRSDLIAKLRVRAGVVLGRLGVTLGPLKSAFALGDDL